MAVTFSLTLNDPDSTYNALYADLQQAASDWSKYLNSNANIRVQIDVGGFPANAGFIVQNDTNDFVPIGTTASGQKLMEPWGEYALQNDASVPGTPYDIHIFFNIYTNPLGAQVYINPNPAAGEPVPSGEYDATTMFRKALGYGLGFAALTTTNASPLNTVTPLDQYVQAHPGGPTGTSLGVDVIDAYQLVGPAVEAVNGGPVALVTPPPGYLEGFVHIGNSPTIGGSSDIEAVTQDIVGQSLQISTLDLAIMQQAGVPIVFPPPVITGTAASAISDATPVAPFSQVAVSNISVGAPATATVTLSSVANGTLSNLGGGSYDANTGVYTITGNATAISAALNGLVFTPVLHEAEPGQTITTTFTLQITDSDGASVTNSNTSVIATGSPAGPATVTGVGGATLSIPFGSYITFTLLQPLLTNISGMVTGGSVVPALAASPPTVPSGQAGLLQIDNSGLVMMPTGYQYAIVNTSAATTIVGGTSNGQLVVAGEGGLTFSAGNGAGSVFAGGGNNIAYVGSASGSQFIALGNGANVIDVVGGNNTVLGGIGSNLIFLGAGLNSVNTRGADTLVSGSGTGFVTATGAQSLIFGNFTSNAGALNAFLGGARATISAANSATSVTTGGANGLVYGSFGTMTGGLSVTDTGHATTVCAGYFGAAATLAGADALMFGDFTDTPGAVGILDNGSADTISAGSSALSATLSGSQALLFGGFGNIAGTLSVLDTGRGDTIVSGNSYATITGGAGSRGLVVFGGTGVFNFVGGSGTATVVAGSGASTITGGTAGSAGNELAGGSGSDVIAAGQGDDTLIAGAGAETLTGGAGADAFLFVSGRTAANVVTIQDFTAADIVYLSGYGTNDAATALNNAASSGGNTSIRLTDHTQVTFVGVAGVAALQGHIVSV